MQIGDLQVFERVVYAACEEIPYAMKRLDPTLALYFALLLAIAETVFLVGTQSLTFGSDQGGWAYAYAADFRLAPLLAAAGLSLVLVVLLHLSLRSINRYQTPVLALWIAVGTLGSSCSIRSIRTRSRTSTSLAATPQTPTIT